MESDLGMGRAGIATRILTHYSRKQHLDSVPARGSCRQVAKQEVLLASRSGKISCKGQTNFRRPKASELYISHEIGPLVLGGVPLHQISCWKLSLAPNFLDLSLHAITPRCRMGLPQNLRAPPTTLLLCLACYLRLLVLNIPRSLA